MFLKKRIVRVIGVVLVVVLVVVTLILGVGYWYVVTGGMIARQEPSSIEAYLGQSILNMSIPNASKLLANPLSANSAADIAAGRDLYAKNCEVCHACDGNGKTELASGLYPPPTSLCGLSTVKRTDGEIFYIIRNGIRNTGMPGWQMDDKPIWQLVSYIRSLPKVATSGPAINHTNSENAQYVGSTACRSCHTGIYDRWKKTLMANVVRDPRQYPEAVIPDLSKPNPLVTFTRDDIDFVYGSKWKQRYFKKVGNDYYPLQAQWDVTHKVWKPYFGEDDWWVDYYPRDNFKRPTSTLCDGCHSVNYDISNKTVTEWNVGCEKCHGPGSEHVKHPVANTIVNPARLDYVQAADTCLQCHSQGRPLANPINGQYYDWPVGFHMGLKLSDFWKLEEHTLGETSFTHFGDGTAHKNRMQGNDYVTSQMYTHGVSCFTCHDSHGSDNNALLRKPATALCLDCHHPKSPSGPNAATIEQHTHHKPGSAGSDCIACHMLKIAQTIGDVNVRSHTFRFIGPAATDALKIPNACNICHADKSTAWTTTILKSWSNYSVWRLRD